MRLDGYIRVSQVRGREGPRFISPAVQRDRIKAYAKAHGHTVARYAEDLDLPGSHSERPGLQDVLSRIDQGRVEGVVVAKLDRFGRSVIDTAQNLKRIEDAGGVLMSVAEGIDTSNPFGRFMVNLMSALAELELDRIRDNWEVARERAVARGVHIASRTPTGYSAGDDGRLVPSESAERVRAAFEAAAGGASWNQLGEVMEGVLTPYGGKHWTSRSLNHLLSNRVYLGEARSGEFTLPDAHEAIVSEAVWQAAQRKPGERQGGSTSLLAGILRCGGCRYAMKPDKMRNRQGERVRIYRCRGKRAAGVCQERAAILGSVVEPWVEARFLEQMGSVTAVRGDLRMRDLQTRKRQARAEFTSYRDSSLIAVIGEREYVEGLAVRADALSAIEAEEDELRAEIGFAADVAGIAERWDGLSVGHRNKLLRSAIDGVFIRRTGQVNVPIAERAHILWRGEAPSDLPGVGRRNAEIVPFEFPG